MRAHNLTVLFLFAAIVTIFSTNLAEAANGTLKVSFRYKDPVTGSVSKMNNGFVYLHNAADAAHPAPMEKYFTMADYILGSNYADGNFTVSVPAGKYYIRLTQRKIIGGHSRPYGPPENGDYTWFQTAPITIAAGGTLDMGTVYANTFGSTITITGIVKTTTGAPLAGRYVHASAQPCLPTICDGSGCTQDTNECGYISGLPVFMAVQPTDANGRYMLQIRDPGTYYIYTTSSLDNNPGCSGYCEAPILGTPYPSYYQPPQPIAVINGDTKTADIIAY